MALLLPFSLKIQQKLVTTLMPILTFVSEVVPQQESKLSSSLVEPIVNCFKPKGTRNKFTIFEKTLEQTRRSLDKVLSSFPLLNALLNTSVFEGEGQYFPLLFNVYELGSLSKELPLEYVRQTKMNKRVMLKMFNLLEKALLCNSCSSLKIPIELFGKDEGFIKAFTHLMVKIDDQPDILKIT